MSLRRHGGRRWGAKAAAAIVLPAAFVLTTVFAGCGAGSAAPVPPSSVATAFADDSFAELATDGDDALWLAVSGYSSAGRFGLRVFRADREGWVALPPPPGKPSGDLPISIAVRGGGADATPCLGYSLGAAQKPNVVCLTEGEWRRIALPSLGEARLFQVGEEEGRLTALLLQRVGDSARYRLLNEAQDRWNLSPSIPVPPAIARLAIESSQGWAASPTVGVTTQGRRPRRYAAELRNGVWHKLGPPVADAELGPTVGGPVVLSGRVLYPVNEADSEPWSFSIHAAGIGSATAREVARLSSGAGNAQGRLDLAGGRLWATWQEDDPRRDGRFRATVYAAELSPRGRVRRKVKLWHGISIGPGSTQVVEFKDRQLALFMPGSSDGKGLRTAVRALP